MAVIIRENIQKGKRIFGFEYNIVPPPRFADIAKDAFLLLFGFYIFDSPGRPESVHYILIICASMVSPISIIPYEL